MTAKQEAEDEVLYSAPVGDLENPRSLYDFNLAFRAAVEAEMTGRVPTPEETAQKPLAWYRDVSLQQQWLKFYRDQWKINHPQPNGNH